MNGTKRLIQRMDIQIAAAIALCMVTFRLVPQLQLLSACTAALMCSQDTGKISFHAGVTRILVTLVGGVIGVGVVLLDGVIANQWVFIALSAVGIFLTLVLCRLCKTPPISGRIGCVTLILVVVVAQGQGRVFYAVSRVIASVYGAAAAAVVACIFAAVAARTVRKEHAPQSEKV